MLLISETIKKREIDPLHEYFQIDDIVAAATKAKSGIGVVLGGLPYPRSRLIKMYLTGRNAPGRLIFFLNTEDGNFIPVLLRLKNDHVGENMSFKNPLFKPALIKNIISAQEDLRLGKYQKIQI